MLEGDLGNNGAFDKGGCNMGMGPNQPIFGCSKMMSFCQFLPSKKNEFHGAHSPNIFDRIIAQTCCFFQQVCHEALNSA